MNEEEFEKELIKEVTELKVTLSQNQIQQFYRYMNLLLEWNQKINLTAIEEPKEIISKHFIDSLTIEKMIEKGSRVVDVGTGAGFPGIPLSIVRQDCEFILLDSLNKRVVFLEEIIKQLKLKNVIAIHIRAEDAALQKEYREKFDVVTSRAVANMSTLLEYMLPLCKIGGMSICMKGSNIEEELEKSKKALDLLKGKIEKVENFLLPFTDYKRNVILVRKTGATPSQYPRRQGKASKEPLG